MVEQMGKGLPVDRHIEVTHVGKIGLGSFTGDMHLLKDDFPLRLCWLYGTSVLKIDDFALDVLIFHEAVAFTEEGM